MAIELTESAKRKLEKARADGSLAALRASQQTASETGALGTINDRKARQAAALKEAMNAQRIVAQPKKKKKN